MADSRVPLAGVIPLRPRNSQHPATSALQAQSIVKALMVDQTHLHCGMQSSYYRVKEEYGKGTCDTYAFDGLQINLLDANLNQPLFSDFRVREPVMELAFVSQGTLLVQPTIEISPFVVEAQESYQEYVPEFLGRFHYLSEIPFRGIRISFNQEFLDRHHLSEPYARIEK
ncbi:MAG: hypothetical protein AAFQ98_09435, partial [Bacteroidota bacterium]